MPERCHYCGLEDPGPEHRAYAPSLCAERPWRAADPRYIEAMAEAIGGLYSAHTQTNEARARAALAAVRALDAQALAAIPQHGMLSRPTVELAAVMEALGIEAGDE